MNIFEMYFVVMLCCEKKRDKDVHRRKLTCINGLKEFDGLFLRDTL